MAGFRVETCPMLESGSDRSPPPPKIGCSSRGYLEKELPPSSTKIRNSVLKPARVQGNNRSAALLLQKSSGSPLRGLLECGLGPARVWAWGLLECGPSSSKKYSGSPLWGLLECVLCAALPFQKKYSSCKKKFGGCAANAFLLLLDMGS